MDYTVTTFYIFTPLKEADLATIKKSLEEKAEKLDISGLLLIAPEGANATISGTGEKLEKYKQVLVDTFGSLRFKDSPSDKQPFKRFKIKIKQEIVQLKREDLIPTGDEPHLTPQQWDELMADTDAVFIDVRNWYETKLGKFKNAIDPKTWKFSQFPEWLKKSDIPKNKKIGIYCTGGIRCEKAALAMKEQGYENVYQLDGGILQYIQERPNKNYEGECFVFDHRTSVTQDLRPSTAIGRCPHCGNGGDIKRVCRQCDAKYMGCVDCDTKIESLCSKDCRYHYNRIHSHSSTA